MPSKTKIWGILNVTPDSFSDGGKFIDKNTAVQAAIKLMEEGANVIDIGAESTRPNATLISAEEEWNRLKDILPIIKQEAIKRNVLISLDTSKGKVAELALGYIDIINDVSALTDPYMQRVVRDSKIPTVIMHHLSIPADIGITLNEDIDAIKEILNWFKAKIFFLEQQGIQRSQLILDPGIGFGKKPLQSLYILGNIFKLMQLNLPILIGHSRKGFLKILGINTIEERDIATASITAILSQAGVDHIRVHNVAQNIKSIKS